MTSASVDLRFTGPIALVANGTAGTCQLGKDASGIVTKFGFSASGTDYPGLGDGFFVEEGNNGFVTVKLLAGAGANFINIQDIQNAVSADHKSITLDADLGGGSATEHVAGTIVCP